MKYRRLSQDELDEMEGDFVQFLASNSITADDWEKLKKEDPEKVEELIRIFSDIVHEKALEKIEYLEFRAPKDIKTFHCGKEKMILYGLRIHGPTSIDLTDEATIQDLRQDPSAYLDKGDLRIYTAEKGYNEERNPELFNMMEKGCTIGGEELFKALKSLKQP